MSQRPSVYVSLRVPCDGGESPNRFLPEITAEIRLFFPPAAMQPNVTNVLLDAIDNAFRDLVRLRRELYGAENAHGVPPYLSRPIRRDWREDELAHLDSNQEPPA